MVRCLLRNFIYRKISIKLQPLLQQYVVTKKPRNAWFFEKRNNSSSVNYGAYFCTRWFKPSSSNIVVFLVLALGKRSGSLNWTARATISGFGILSPAELSVVRVIQPSRVNLSNPYSIDPSGAKLLQQYCTAHSVRLVAKNSWIVKFRLLYCHSSAKKWINLQNLSNYIA